MSRDFSTCSSGGLVSSFVEFIKTGGTQSSLFCFLLLSSITIKSTLTSTPRISFIFQLLSLCLKMSQPDVRFTENRLGGKALVIDGCKYRINRRAGRTVYWRCFFRWCRANAVVEDGKLKSNCGVHICDQPLNGAHGKQPGRHHHQRQLQQTPVIQQTAVQQRRPVTAAAASPSTAAVRSGPSAVKMPTRAAQGTQQTLTRNASKATKAALRSQKPSTNNNMVVRRKSKATEEDSKLSISTQPSVVDSPETKCAATKNAIEINSSPKEVYYY